jgi:hypothetical protein
VVRAVRGHDLDARSRAVGATSTFGRPSVNRSAERAVDRGASRTRGRAG